MNTARHPEGHFTSADKIAILFTILVSVHRGQINLLETERRFWCQSSSHTLGDQWAKIPPKAVQSSNSTGAFHLEPVKTEPQQWL